jgi:xanthine dehydrogenase accessory factor
MTDRIYRLIAEMVERGEPGALATVIRTERSVPRHAGSKMIIRVDGSTEGSVGGGGLEAKVIVSAKTAIDDGCCLRVRFDLAGQDGVCGGDSEVFIEPILTRVPFLVMGLGHVGRALLEVGAGLAYRFIAVDDRPEFLQDLGEVETRLAKIPAAGGALELVETLRLTPRTIVLICNRNHELDGQALEAVFAAEETAGSECAFIGMVGQGPAHRPAFCRRSEAGVPFQAGPITCRPVDRRGNTPRDRHLHPGRGHGAHPEHTRIPG